MPEHNPNILFLIDDQHRHDWLGFLNPGLVETPNIDGLAERGTAFTHCCTGAPVCAPSRIALATGLLPTRTGATSNHDYHPLSVPNHYQWFRDHGYRVELVGRHDLAKDGAPASIHGNRPLNYSFGFTRALEVEGGMSAARDSHRAGGPTGPYTKYLADNGLLDTYVGDFIERQSKGWIIGASHDSVLPGEHHQDEFVGNAAVERIRSMEDDYPWFMFVSFQSPHDPFDPPADLGEKYRDQSVPDAIPVRLEDKPRRIAGRYESYKHATSEDITIARRQYCGKVELIDRQVGKILSALEEKGATEDTIVVFCSDHGEHLGDHGLFIKQTAYEPSLRVPLIVAGPGVERGRSNALVELFDLNPTLVELAGLPQQHRLDALSFASVLRGRTNEHRDACVTCLADFRAIRSRTHTYIETFNDRTELYDLREDPDQRTNVVDDQPEVATELRSRLAERFTQGKWMR